MEDHSKLKDLFYSELKMQNYFLSDELTVEQVQCLFSYRTRMATFSENFRGQFGPVTCPLCFCHLDNQPMSFQCQTIRENVTIKGKYENIFLDNVQSDLAQTLCEIMKFRENHSNKLT